MTKKFTNLGARKSLFAHFPRELSPPEIIHLIQRLQMFDAVEHIISADSEIFYATRAGDQVTFKKDLYDCDIEVSVPAKAKKETEQLALEAHAGLMELALGLEPD